MSQLSDNIMNPPNPADLVKERDIPNRPNVDAPQVLDAPMGDPTVVPNLNQEMNSAMPQEGLPVDPNAPQLAEQPMGEPQPGGQLSQPDQIGNIPPMEQQEMAPPYEHDLSQFPPGTFSVPQVLNPDMFVRDQGYQPTGYDPTQQYTIEALSQLGQLTPQAVLQANHGAKFNPNIMERPEMDFDLQSTWSQVKPIHDEAFKTGRRMVFREMFGWNPDNSEQKPNGDAYPIVPQIEMDQETRGAVTEMGSALRDKFRQALKRANIDDSKLQEKQKVTPMGAVSWLFEDAKNALTRWWTYTENLGDDPKAGIQEKALGTTVSMLLNPLGNFKEKFLPEQEKKFQEEAKANFNETMERFAGVREAQMGLGFGEYGNAGVVSGGIYFLNYLMGLASGAMYDISDNTIQRLRLGEDPYEGSRFWDAATKGRDFSVVQRWKPENYLSLMEPEGMQVGQIADQAKLDPRALPGTARWWNMPERIAEGIARLPNTILGRETTEKELQTARESSRTLHYLTQLAPAMAIEMIGDNGLDRLAQAGIQQAGRQLLGKTDTVLKQIDNPRIAGLLPAAPEVNPAAVNSTIDLAKKSDGSIDLSKKVVVNKRSGTIAIIEPNGNFEVKFKVNPQPTGSILNPEKAIDDSVIQFYAPKTHLYDSRRYLQNLDFVPRSSDDLGRLANQVSDLNGNPMARISRPLTQNETAVLRGIDSTLFGENGTPLKLSRLETGTHVVDDAGQAYEIMRPIIAENSDEVLGVSNANAVEIYQKLDNKVAEAWDEASRRFEPDLIATYNELVSRRNMAIAKAADNGEAYDMLRNKLPRSMDVPSQREVGNQYISARIQAEGEMAEVRKLEQEIAQLNTEVKKVETNMQAFPLHRGDLQTELHTKEWSLETPNPELRLDPNPNINPAPPLDPIPPEKYVIPKNPGEMPNQVYVRRWKSTRQEKLETEWFHGTASTADIRSVDPIQGGSPSEFGLGVYLTLDYDTAVAAGRKGDFSNKPFTQAANKHYDPKLHTVNVGRLDGIVNGNDVVGADIRKAYEVAIKDALEEAGLSSNGVNLRNGIKGRDLFNEPKVAYYNATGNIMPESVYRKFQQNLTQTMQEMGINGMHVNRNGIKTLVVYDPKVLEVKQTIPVPRTNKLGETLESARYLEGRAFEQLGDDVSRANYYKAQKDWLDWQLQQTVEARLVKEGNLINLADDIADTRKTIQEQGFKVNRANFDDLTDNSPKRVLDEQLKIDQSHEGTLC